MGDDFNTTIQAQGYYLWPWRQDIWQWSQSMLGPAKEMMAAAANQYWWRYQNTWFAGVNVLPNTPFGQINQGPPIPAWLHSQLETYCLGQTLHLDKGQVSACRVGYPKQGSAESDKAHQFRQQHFAAHLDGLIPEGQNKRRFLREHHSFILGVPLTKHSAFAAPLMVWPNSHRRLQLWLKSQLAHVPVQDWDKVDLTDAYQLQRRVILQDTDPVALPAIAGEVYLLHRHMLHGMGRWPDENKDDGNAERIIVYFRPEMHSMETWLTAP